MPSNKWAIIYVTITLRTTSANAVQIENRIYNFVENTGWGEMLHAPMDLYLDEKENAVQPDIILIKKGSACHVEDDGFVYGVPEIIIEILSKGNENHDKRVKKVLYEKFGVPEYFIIEPSTKNVLCYVLSPTGYVLKYEQIGMLKSELLQHSFSF